MHKKKGLSAVLAAVFGVVLMGSLAHAAVDGKAIYEAKCKMCHGVDGKKVADVKMDACKDAVIKGKGKMPAIKVSPEEAAASCDHMKTLK